MLCVHRAVLLTLSFLITLGLMKKFNVYCTLQYKMSIIMLHCFTIRLETFQCTNSMQQCIYEESKDITMIWVHASDIIAEK